MPQPLSPSANPQLLHCQLRHDAQTTDHLSNYPSAAPRICRLWHSFCNSLCSRRQGPKPARSFTALGLAALICGLCSCTPSRQDGPPLHDIDVSQVPNAVPHQLPKSRYGNPKQYTVLGVTYHVLPTARGYDRRGIASWYGTKFHGQLTSTRERYNLYAMTAANKVLPLPCFARVTNLNNGLSVIVKINDRGPFAPHRIIDLSYSAAKKLGVLQHGTALVEVKTISTFNTHRSTQHHLQQPLLHSTPHRTQQIAAFNEYPHALQLLKRLRQQGHHHARIVRVHTRQHTLYRVLI